MKKVSESRTRLFIGRICILTKVSVAKISNEINGFDDHCNKYFIFGEEKKNKSKIFFLKKTTLLSNLKATGKTC